MESVGKSLGDRLLFAVPKKGRLHQPCIDLLAGSDIQFHRHNRLDIALVKNFPIALVFLPAADIPTFVGEGRVDLGITGRDQVAEHEVTSPPTETSGVEEVLDLGFGKCKLQVQVPEKGGITKPEQLVGMTVGSSFTQLATKYFRELEAKEATASASASASTPVANGDPAAAGPSETGLKTRIQYLGGSVEAACMLGVAHGIVDLVESGETMRAAGLTAISTVVESTAVLIRSKRPSHPALVELIASRIRGVITAQKYVLCTYNVARSRLEAATAITPGKRAPTVTALDEKDWVAVSAMVESRAVADVMDRLEKVGAEDILVIKIENSRTRVGGNGAGAGGVSN